MKQLFVSFKEAHWQFSQLERQCCNASGIIYLSPSLKLKYLSILKLLYNWWYRKLPTKWKIYGKWKLEIKFFISRHQEFHRLQYGNFPFSDWKLFLLIAETSRVFEPGPRLSRPVGHGCWHMVHDWEARSGKISSRISWRFEDIGSSKLHNNSCLLVVAGATAWFLQLNDKLER